MEDQVLPTIEQHFGDLTDPRMDRTKLHPLLDILVIAMCAVIAGADNWEDVEEFGKARHAWFQTFLGLPNGIPSHDTFTRVFARLDPEQFQADFLSWMSAVSEVTGGQVIAIDGKVLRRSHDKGIGKAAIDMVSAWASANRLVLGQVKVDDKSNEITAIPELIKTLALQGAIVTIDAMGCQKKITRTIIEEKADYVIQVKDNQQGLREDIALFFHDTANARLDTFQTIDGEHGRIETRRYFTTSDIDWLAGKHEWAGINTICMAIRQREVHGKTSSEKAYFISSLQNNAPTIAKAIRDHWGIENGLHWCLDISFREDHCRVRKDHAPENLGILRHMATNLLKREKSLKGGIQTKRLKAAWDHDYLLKVLTV